MEAKEEYALYNEDPNYKQCLINALIVGCYTIRKFFPNVRFSMYGRIKSEESYLRKAAVKESVNDLYAFKVVIEHVPDDYVSSDPAVIEAQKDLAKKDLSNVPAGKIEVVRDKLNVAVASEITRFLADENAPFLKTLSAKKLKFKHFDKDNGYISDHLVAEMNIPIHTPRFEMHSISTLPNAKSKPRFELHGISGYRNEISKPSHNDYKDKVNRPEDIKGIIHEILNCKDMDDFNEVCRKVPTYFTVRNTDKGPIEIVEFSNHFAVLHFCSEYLLAPPDTELYKKYHHACEVVNDLYSDNILIYKEDENGKFSVNYNIYDSPDVITGEELYRRFKEASQSFVNEYSIDDDITMARDNALKNDGYRDDD